MHDIPETGIEIPEVNQVGFVVENLEDGVERFQKLFGVTPWTEYRLEPPELVDTTYRGEPVEFGFRAALAYAGETNLELIEPTMGPNIYEDHLEAHGEGMHHLKASFANETKTYEVIRQFEDAGIDVIQSGSYKGSEFWYFDTASECCGLVFETSIRRNYDEREPANVYE